MSVVLVCLSGMPALLAILPLFLFFFESRILTCLTYTSRRGSQHRGQTAEQEDTKAQKAKLQRPRTAAQGSLSHKQQAKQANKGPDRTLELQVATGTVTAFRGGTCTRTPRFKKKMYTHNS